VNVLQRVAAKVGDASGILLLAYLAEKNIASIAAKQLRIDHSYLQNAALVDDTVKISCRRDSYC